MYAILRQIFNDIISTKISDFLKHFFSSHLIQHICPVPGFNISFIIEIKSCKIKGLHLQVYNVNFDIKHGIYP